MLLVAQSALPAEFSPKDFGLKACGSATVADVPSGDRLYLQNGDTLQLADIKAPELWDKTSAYKSWPYAYDSRAYLTSIALGKKVSLYCYRQKRTFEGHLNAHVLIENAGTNALWLQSHLTENGAAFFYPGSYAKPALRSLYNKEENAKTAQHGLWQIKSYMPKAADSSDIKTGWFQIITGKVLSTKKVKQRIYLNFGDDWRTDFTVEIPNKIETGMQKAGIDTLSLETQTIEVRGWVEWGGGPKIILTSAGNLRKLVN